MLMIRFYISEYIAYHCEKNGWTALTKVQVNTAVTNKTTNVRKKWLSIRQ